VAEHQDLKVLGGVTAGHQPEQLDGTAQREVGELRQHPGTFQAVSGGVTLPRHDQANQQVTGRIRASVPFRRWTESLPLDRAGRREGLPTTGGPGIMGGMPEVDARRRVSPTSPSGSRMAAQAAPCTRPRPWTSDPCRGPGRVSHGLSVRPAGGGGVVNTQRATPAGAGPSTRTPCAQRAGPAGAEPDRMPGVGSHIDLGG
jgi:hypothetical protein